MSTRKQKNPTGNAAKKPEAITTKNESDSGNDLQKSHRIRLLFA